MIQVRQGVFETNSSSTHSICIPKKCDKIIDHVYFGLGEYGLAHDEADPASYLYTGILSTYSIEEAQELIKKLVNILNANNIEFDFEQPKYEFSRYDGHAYLGIDSGYVNHANELRPFIKQILDNEDMLLRYLSDGKVYTGNDNEDPDWSGCYIAEKTMWEYNDDYSSYIEKPNPYHDEENYDYYFKDN